MTLIKCPECQREISNSSKQCIHCGYPLAEKANVTKSVISYYENRDRSPSPDVVKRFSEIFNVSTDYLLGANNREIPDMIDVSGLSEKEVAALKLIIDSMKGRK